MEATEIDEVAPETTCESKLYKHTMIAGGRYRIPRMSIGPYGKKLWAALEGLKGLEGAELDQAFENLFRVAMGVFYSEATIEALLNDGNVDLEVMEAIVDSLTFEMAAQ